MGAKTWMLVYSNGPARTILKAAPVLDRAATLAFAQQLFPADKLTEIEDGSLSYTNPPDDELVVGCFPGLSVIAAAEFGIDYPSQLPAEFVARGRGQTLTLHAMHSVVDWFAYAIWQDGKLQRALSLSPDSGILEDIGPKLPFEAPYWAGEHPAIDPEDEDEENPYPFVFHPLELGEAALLDCFGYQIEGFVDPEHLEPEDVVLMRFRRSAR
jgi:hypothetical protein